MKLNGLFLVFLMLQLFLCDAQVVIKINASKTTICSYDTIDLNAVIQKGTPTIYKWTVEEGTLSNSSSANSRYNHGVTNTKFIKIFLEATDGSNKSYDSIKITVMPLPAVLVKDQEYCQSVDEISLNKLVIMPTNPISGNYYWSCFNCVGLDDSKLIFYDKVGFYKDYYLNIRDSVVSIDTNSVKTIHLIYTYISDFGCINSDTSKIEIESKPIVEPLNLEPICWSNIGLAMNQYSNVALNGKWIDNSGKLKIIKEDSLYIKQISEMGGQFELTYQYDKYCNLSLLTQFTVKPNPKVVIAKMPKYVCEKASNFALKDNPTGGIWKTSANVELKDSIYLNQFPTDDSIHFYYYYTDTASGCISSDSFVSIIESYVEINLAPLDTIYRELRNELFEHTVINKVRNKRAIGWTSYGIGELYLSPQWGIRFDSITISINIDYKNFDEKRDYGAIQASALSNSSGCGNMQWQQLFIFQKQVYGLTDLVSQIIISPNPFTSLLQINNNNKEQLSLNIFDSFGKLVYTCDWLDKNTNLDLSMLNSGAYYLAFSSLSGQKAHYKVMKI